MILGFFTSISGIFLVPSGEMFEVCMIEISARCRTIQPAVCVYEAELVAHQLSCKHEKKSRLWFCLLFPKAFTAAQNIMSMDRLG